MMFGNYDNPAGAIELDLDELRQSLRVLHVANRDIHGWEILGIASASDKKYIVAKVGIKMSPTNQDEWFIQLKQSPPIPIIPPKTIMELKNILRLPCERN